MDKSEINRLGAPGGSDRQPFSWRRWLLAAMALGLLIGLLLLGLRAYRLLAAGDMRLTGALVGGLAAAAATAAGTIPVLLFQRFSQRVSDTMLGFGAGVMLAASAFSLVLPALAAARAGGAGPWQAGLLVSTGILLGAALLLSMDHWLPHEHFVKGLEGGHQARALKRAWLFVFAIALHNMPEGLAIGVGFAGLSRIEAQALALGISIQDIPEGLVVAMALRGVGYSRLLSVGLGVISGLIEPVAAVFGAAVFGLSASLLPWGLAAAAGAMLFVVSHEIIPESHRQGHEAFATGGLMFGFVLMMLLDTALS
jgi:zinc transporter, ZIP family